MQRSRLPLSALRSFEAAGRHGSFAEAANELGVTPSAVSRQIAELERIVGGRLFTRRVRKVQLTPEGDNLQRALSEASDQITETLLTIRVQLRESERVDTLSVLALPTLAARIILPRLAGFEAIHPANPVALTVASGRRASLEPAFDLEIAYSRQAPDSREALLLAEEAIPVCSPGYATTAMAGGSGDPAAVLRGRLLGATQDLWDWRLWATRQGLKWPSRPEVMLFDTADLAIQAAIAGTGIALVERSFAAAELADGRLVRLLAPLAAAPLGYYVWRTRPGREGAARPFRNWLDNEIQALRG